MELRGGVGHVGRSEQGRGEEGGEEAGADADARCHDRTLALVAWPDPT
jgi:hypothetical protein